MPRLLYATQRPLAVRCARSRLSAPQVQKAGLSMQLSGGTPHVRAGQCGLRETRQQFQIGRRCTGPGGLTVCDRRPGRAVCSAHAICFLPRLVAMVSTVLNRM
jgi:hypothetical protein